MVSRKTTEVQFYSRVTSSLILMQEYVRSEYGSYTSSVKHHSETHNKNTMMKQSK